MQGKNVKDLDIGLVTRSGPTVSVLLSMTPTTDLNGKVIGTVAVATDITERKKLDEQNSRLANELASFIRTANAPIFAVDNQGRIAEWNNKAVKVWRGDACVLS